MIHYLSLEEFEQICFWLTKEFYEFDEPIPNFETRFPQKIESILEMPDQVAFGKELYSNIYSKAVCYFFFIIKNHPFLNGNKRIAIITTYMFLRLNGYKLKIPDDSIYKLAIKTAKFKGNHKKMFEEIEEIFKKYTKKVKS